MKPIKYLAIYLLGNISYLVITCIAILLLSFVFASFPSLEKIISFGMFGEGFIAILFYGPAFFATSSFIDTIATKAKISSKKTLIAIGITIIVVQTCSMIINIINGTSIIYNIIGIIPGIAFIYAGKDAENINYDETHHKEDKMQDKSADGSSSTILPKDYLEYEQAFKAKLEIYIRAWTTRLQLDFPEIIADFLTMDYEADRIKYIMKIGRDKFYSNERDSLILITLELCRYGLTFNEDPEYRNFCYDSYNELTLIGRQVFYFYDCLLDWAKDCDLISNIQKEKYIDEIYNQIG